MKTGITRLLLLLAIALMATGPAQAAPSTELAFLGQVFGFSPADDVPPLEIPGLEAFAAAMAGASGGGSLR